MDKSESITGLAKSLIALQGELKPVSKDAINPFFKSKYADLSSIWDACRGLLTKHGFALSQLPHVQDGQIVLTTLLLHETGEWLSSDLLVTPVKPNDPQAVGSALTYSRRYGLSAILGICSEEDDDAETAMERTKKESTKGKPDVVASAEAFGTSQLDFKATAPQAPKQPPKEPGEFANAGEFLTHCSKNLGLNRSQVLKALDAASLDGIQFADAYIFLRDFQEGSRAPVPPPDKKEQ